MTEKRSKKVDVQDLVQAEAELEQAVKEMAGAMQDEAVARKYFMVILARASAVTVKKFYFEKTKKGE